MPHNFMYQYPSEGTQHSFTEVLFKIIFMHCEQDKKTSPRIYFCENLFEFFKDLYLNFRMNYSLPKTFVLLVHGVRHNKGQIKLKCLQTILSTNRKAPLNVTFQVRQTTLRRSSFDQDDKLLICSINNIDFLIY